MATVVKAEKKKKKKKNVVSTVKVAEEKIIANEESESKVIKNEFRSRKTKFKSGFILKIVFMSHNCAWCYSHPIFADFVSSI